MASLPRERAPDSTLALLQDPYGFIAKHARAHGSDVFEARILLRPTILMTGREAARIFYDRERFMREGAAPVRLQKTLFGRGGVQGLDGAEHAARRAMLLAIMRPERVEALCDEVARVWRAQAMQWERKGQVVLYDEMREILARAVCSWAGMPLRDEVVKERTDQLASLFEGAGRMGAPQWKARANRAGLERLLAARIAEVRAGERVAPMDSALGTIAHHRDAHGEPLSLRVAAVELLNILRPTIAVAVYITFLAHALHLHPDARERVGRGGYHHLFVQEVRRMYPFFPAVAAKVRRDFEWRGHRFQAGRRVLLDLYGTNHDPRIWRDPQKFDPDRFRDQAGDPFGFVPQGGGDPVDGHRCVGEAATVAIMETALRILVRELRYDVPPQDLDIDMSVAPALPRSGFIIDQVQHVGPEIETPLLRRRRKV